MALKTKLNEIEFGVGDEVKVFQKITEAEGKTRVQIFEGMVIGIRGTSDGQSFMVRRIGSGGIGIERIFPILAPSVEKVEVVRKGIRGVRQAKLYYVRGKSRKEIEKIYSRNTKRENAKAQKEVSKPKKKTVKKIVKKSSRKTSKKK